MINRRQSSTVMSHATTACQQSVGAFERDNWSGESELY